MNKRLSEEWAYLQKHLSWNGIKALLCAILPLMGFFYIYIPWMNLVSPLMEEYDKAMQSSLTVAATEHNAIMTLCLTAGFIAPLFFAFPIMSFGLWLGKAIKFYRDDKTKYIYFDGVSYYIEDLQQDRRDKIKEILSSYKSKSQLRKDKLAKKNWFWRNFG